MQWEELEHASTQDRQDSSLYRAKGILPLRLNNIGLEHVAAAFQRSEVAKFDARRLLPPGALNITLLQLSNMNGAGARSVPYNSGALFSDVARCHTPLLNLIQKFPRWGPQSELVAWTTRVMIPWMLDQECPPVRSLSQVGEASVNFSHEEMRWSSLHRHTTATNEKYRTSHKENRSIQTGAISARRLAGFKNIDFATLLGIGELVEHVHAFVRLGPTGGLYHNDMFDNIIVQVSTTIDVVVVPANCSHLVTSESSRATTILPSKGGILEWATQGMRRGQSKVPFYHFKLRPGEGVVLPSGAVHNVFARSPHRIGLSAFMEPKFGKMQWGSSAPAGAFGRADRGYLAARSVAVRVLKKLWERRRLGMFWHTARLELI
ncbi:unnamed protein product [Prorocentrum cordatum]|nr:unnamed protein product [Polarella glacialis]